VDFQRPRTACSACPWSRNRLHY